MKNFNLLITFIFISVWSHWSMAQSPYPFAYTDTIPVSKNGTALKQPWVGGMNNAQFNMMDVNMDCLNDLVVFDIKTNGVKVYINEGDSANPDYVYDQAYESYFPDDLEAYLFLRDYNNDGKLDIFTFAGISQVSFKVYKNVSDSVLKWDLVVSGLKADFGSGPQTDVYAVPGNMPAIVDVDGDGDLDIVSFPVAGAGVEFYENISPNHDSLHYALTSRCWGHFAENALDSIVLGYTCKGNARVQGNSQRHSGGGITIHDLDEDGLVDVIYTDAGDFSVKMLLNGGDSTSAEMVSVEYNYPASNTPIHIAYNPITEFLDLDHNNHPYMVSVGNNIRGSADTGNVWLYENMSTSGLADYQLVQKDFLVGEQIDVGTDAYPIYFDVNGDGLEDLLISNKGYFDSSDIFGIQFYFTSQISYYENVGTAASPAFDLVTDDWLGMRAKGYEKLMPAFGDLNGDGVQDMIVGQSNGYISYYENMGVAGGPANFVLQSDSFTFNQFGENISPVLYDIDGDNLLDLVVGQKSGNIRVYQNLGDSVNPWFQWVLTDTLGGIFNHNIYKSTNTANIAIGDLDGVQGKVLVVSTETGYAKIYSGIETNPMGPYTLLDSVRVSSEGEFGVGLGKLGTSDSLTLTIGEMTGGVRLFELNHVAVNYQPYPVTPCEPPVDSTDPGDSTTLGIELSQIADMFALFPNPSTGAFNVHYTGSGHQEIGIRVIDLGGKTLYTQQLGIAANSSAFITPGVMPKGMVIVEITTADGTVYKRLAIQ